MNFSDYFSKNFFRSRRLSRLPERVRERLRERERANEVLIRILQLLIVMTFLTLYLLASKTGTDTAFRPVPLCAGGYAVLSVIGLIWSVRSRLPDWSVYCSILFDFTLLYTLMISFHYQYEQPASFILKAPTLPICVHFHFPASAAPGMEICCRCGFDGCCRLADGGALRDQR